MRHRSAQATEDRTPKEDVLRGGLMWQRTRMHEWLTERLGREDLWKEHGALEKLVDNLAEKYTTGDRPWRVHRWTEQVPPRPVYLVTRGGIMGIQNCET